MVDSGALRIFLVAGEHSGDQLGGPLIAALRKKAPRLIHFMGVGGEAMEQEGCPSLFPLSDIAVMGPLAILRRLPTLVRRVRETVDAIVAMQPDIVIILDSPEFTHAVAKRVRRKLQELPIIDYVSPSVWAWRSGRAKKMRRYVDHILAILPFEPDVHKRLGGPECTYVGHPLIEKLDWIRMRDDQGLARRLKLSADEPVVMVLPGSRVTEITRMMSVYADAIGRLIERNGRVQVVIAVAAGCEDLVTAALSSWRVKPHLLMSEEDKYAAFRLADAALATSGTVTLELALAGTPLVVGYHTEAIVALFRWMLKAHSIVLPNLVLGRNAFPEFIQEDASAEALAGALQPLLDASSRERKEQVEALAQVENRMRLPSGTPSERAADVVLRHIDAKR